MFFIFVNILLWIFYDYRHENCIRNVEHSNQIPAFLIQKRKFEIDNLDVSLIFNNMLTTETAFSFSLILCEGQGRSYINKIECRVYWKDSQTLQLSLI